MNEQEHLHPERPEEQLLDQVLRSVLAWQAPPEVTERLIRLVPTITVSAAVSHPPNQADLETHDRGATTVAPHPSRWYSILVMILTTMAVGVSFAVTWQFYGMLGTELGLNQAWSDLQVKVAWYIQQVREEVPLLSTVADTIMVFYGQASWLLSWLLLAIVLWLAFDNQTTTGAEMQRQQQSS